MADRIDIGIDGGGTGCRLALSVDGAEPVEFRGGPANIVTDPEGAEAAICAVLDQALDAQGLTRDDLTVARICAGLAGARLPGAADAFATRLPFLAYVVDDSVTAFEAAFSGGDGTLASLGTGSFFIARRDGVLRHIGGWGFHLGDEGSAAWLGRRALTLSLHVADGRLPPDPLADHLRRIATPDPVRFARAATPGQFTDLARAVFEMRDTPLATRLIGEVEQALRDGLRDVGHQQGQPWVLTGGLGSMIAPMLPPDLAEGLGSTDARPLDGALRLARGLP